jgi:cytochrome oxidase Cu insertion factor (SCO1/SenC/PrrC family)/mono/diheme cytochrome c family protein
MRRHFLAGFAAVLALVLGAPGGRAESRWGGEYVPNLPVTTQDGTALHFWDDLIKDKLVVIGFIYTSCTDLCPLTTARMAEMRDRLGASFGRDVFFISLTVDPEHDTPERLKAFADAFDARGPAWQFVTGRPEDIERINARFGDKSAERGLSSHRNEIVIGNGKTGAWTRNSVFSDLEEVIRDVRSMDAAWADRPRPAHENHGVEHVHEMANTPGEILFKKACAACHTIGGGDKVGPDLRGVTERREEAWLKRFISNPPQLRASGDPGLQALMQRFPAVRMPLLGLGEVDAGDALEYIRKRSAELAAREASLPPAGGEPQPR